MKNDFKANKTFIFPKIHLDGWQRLGEIDDLYNSFVYSKKKKKKDAVCRINCALCSPT